MGTKQAKKSATPGNRTAPTSLTIAEPIKRVASVYGKAKYGSLTAYIEYLLREDLQSIGFEIGDPIEEIAKQAGVKLRAQPKSKRKPGENIEL